MRLAVLVLCLLLPAPAYAQICRGRADVSRAAPGQAGVGFTHADDQSGFSGVVVGGSDAFFVEGSAGLVSIDSLDASGPAVGLIVGGQIPLDRGRRVVVCPGGVLGSLWLTEVQSVFGPFDAWSLNYGGGISVGAALGDRAFQFIPALGMTYQQQRVRISAEGESATETGTFTLLDLAFGLVFQERFTVRPAFAIEFIDGSTASAFGLSFTAGWGR